MFQFFQSNNDLVSSFINSLGYPEHLHSELELFCVYEDDICVNINNVSYWMKKGDVACIFPFQLHGYDLKDFHFENYKSIGIIAPIGELGNMAHIIRQYLPQKPVITSDDVHSDVYMALANLKKCIDNNDSREIISAYLQLILARIIPHMDLKKSAEKKGDIIMQRAVTLIDERYNEALTLESVANELQISKSYLSHILTNKTNKGFMEFLNYTRVNHAKALLRTTNEAIINIAYESGFASLRSFNRNFQKVMAMNPGKYRRQQQKDLLGI